MPFIGKDLTKKRTIPKNCNQWWYPYIGCPEPLYTFFIPEYTVWQCPTCKQEYWLDKHAGVYNNRHRWRTRI